MTKKKKKKKKKDIERELTTVLTLRKTMCSWASFYKDKINVPKRRMKNLAFVFTVFECLHSLSTESHEGDSLVGLLKGRAVVSVMHPGRDDKPQFWEQESH